jgi:sugar lactone lactonase YvrE
VRRIAGVSLFWIGLLYGCSHPPSTRLAVAKSPIPVALAVDTVIDGAIYGMPLKSPTGIFLDGRGDIIVCDQGNHRVVRFSSDLKPNMEAGGRGSAEGLFNDPVSGAADGPLNVRVVDRGNRRICRYDSRLQFVDDIPFSDLDDPLKFGAPQGAAVDKSGNVWVSDRDNNRIAVFSLIGQFEKFAGEFGSDGGGLLNPGKVVIDRDGSYHIADIGNKRIAIYDEYGNFSRAITNPELQEPTGLCVDDQKQLWVVDKSTAQILLFSLEGGRILKADPMLPGLTTRLKSPTDLVISGSRLIITDTGNDRLVVCRIISSQD